MAYSKETPLKQGIIYCMCEDGRLRKNGIDVTDNLKKLGIDRRIVEGAGGKEALDFYVQKQKEAKVDLSDI